MALLKIGYEPRHVEDGGLYESAAPFGCVLCVVMRDSAGRQSGCAFLTFPDRIEATQYKSHLERSQPAWLRSIDRPRDDEVEFWEKMQSGGCTLIVRNVPNEMADEWARWIFDKWRHIYSIGRTTSGSEAALVVQFTQPQYAKEAIAYVSSMQVPSSQGVVYAKSLRNMYPPRGTQRLFVRGEVGGREEGEV